MASWPESPANLFFVLEMLISSLRCFVMCIGALGAFSSGVIAKAVDPPEPKTASEIYWSLQKLNTLGRVLYMAAHPDDENTSLIAYLSLGRQYDAGYLSLTRGDGGQNLIGPELREQLGVIRTQELIEARGVDRGRQFFSRAVDFGYSKTAEETFRIWDREAILADTVWVIRNFQPDVIVTRFNPEDGYTHGHHTASAILAVEAFEAAADPAKFPEQLEFVEPWQVKRVVWNTSSWFFRRSGQQFDENDYVELEVGGYSPLLGRSYNEIASVSRSMHRSQGFGTRTDRGSRREYFKVLVGEEMASDLLDGVDTSWNRVEGGRLVQNRVDSIIADFDLRNPANSVPQLIELKGALASIVQSDWVKRKSEEVDAIIVDCLGLDMRMVADVPYVAAGQKIEVTLEALNRTQVRTKLESLRFNFAEEIVGSGKVLGFNEGIQMLTTVKIPSSMPLPQPYWLERKGTLGMFSVSEQSLIGKAENDPHFYGIASLLVEGEEIELKLPLVFREVDPAFGERIKPVVQLPLVSISFVSSVSLFPNYEPREVTVEVSSLQGTASGQLKLDLPSDWDVTPREISVDPIAEGSSKLFTFLVTPIERSEQAEIQAKLSRGDEIFSTSVTRIKYEHIREQTIFEPASTEAISLKVEKAGQRIGYIPGAGDSVADSLREIGYEVVELNPKSIDAARLEGFDSVVLGIRAYNTVEGIGSVMDALYAFVETGGTVVVQYNTSHRLNLQNIAPFPLSLSRDRVTDEFAAVEVLAPDHPVLNFPNKIEKGDFDGWVQERGLYFPNEWSDAFTPILSLADPGEPASEGSLLVAQHGDGYFVYTGLSWFRQLPAGVPGAYRIFANLVSLGHEVEKR